MPNPHFIRLVRSYYFCVEYDTNPFFFFFAYNFPYQFFYIFSYRANLKQ